jgi:hypothetical protein
VTVTESGRASVDQFFASYFAHDPVTATFTGIHDFDDKLPDWSAAGLEQAAGTMAELRRELATAGVESRPRDIASADRALADAHLEIRSAEQAGRHFHRANAALWTGEAIFSVLSLALREFGTVDQRVRNAAARARAIPKFLRDAQVVLDGPLPPAWTERAQKECAAAKILFDTGVATWIATIGAGHEAAAELKAASLGARVAFASFGDWLRGRAAAPPDRYACGVDLFDMLLARGHWCAESRVDMLREARERLSEERSRLNEMAQSIGGWPDVQRKLADDHPAASEFVDTFAREWNSCRSFTEANNLVTWADTPVRFVPTPPFARAAAPSLYFLNYRSPAPFDVVPVHTHFTPVIDGSAPAEQERVLRAANRSVIRLNHVIHHAALGHHVQNHHAAFSRSRIGQVAAVDGASRIAMFAGGTLAEGWACYAVDLADELGYLTPLEQVAEQHTRVRILCRAVVDLSLHAGELPLDKATAFYVEQVQMEPAAARAEAVKNSMFPGAAVMYWLGTRGIHALRVERSRRAGFSMRAFHDELLSYGAMPVPLIASLMSATP